MKKVGVFFLLLGAAYVALLLAERLIFAQSLSILGVSIEAPVGWVAKTNSESGSLNISFPDYGQGNFISVGGHDALTTGITKRLTCGPAKVNCGHLTIFQGGRCGIFRYGRSTITGLVVAGQETILFFHRKEENMGRLMLADLEKALGISVFGEDARDACFDVNKASSLFEVSKD